MFVISGVAELRSQAIFRLFEEIKRNSRVTILLAAERDFKEKSYIHSSVFSTSDSITFVVYN